MKKLITLVVVCGSLSLSALTSRISFNESARKGGTFRVTAHVVPGGAQTEEVAPSATPYNFETPLLNCTERFEVTVVGGEFDGSYINAPLPLAFRCMNKQMRFAKAGELEKPGTKRGEPGLGHLLFTSTDGKLAVLFTP